MTHQELKAIIDGGEYCIQCPSDYATNERWKKYVKSCHDNARIDQFEWYYSPTEFKFYVYAAPHTESKTVLTLDEWWSVMGDDTPKMYTIQDLAEGRCAVANDGLLLELREVLKAVDSRFNASGFFDFYFVLDGKGKAVNATTLPTQSVKVFIEELRGRQGASPTAWQPKEGEMVEVSDDGKEWGKRRFIGYWKDWFMCNVDYSDSPFGWKHIRPIQTIPVSLDDLKAAYAEKHNIDVNKITLNP